MTITVRVPASTANLGPAFDCLGLALDLWNETRFEVEGKQLELQISGEGADHLPRDEKNLILRSFAQLYNKVGEKPPMGLSITCKQDIPLSSGLGSSAAACLTGLLAANALLGEPLKREAIVQLGAEIEGHADNLSAALLGGQVLVTEENGNFNAQKLDCASLHAVVVLPEVRLSTREARLALPQQVLLRDAVFNIGRSLQTLEALRTGDVAALSTSMQDRLHQPYRLPLIPGAAEAIAAAQAAGAAAALSGAGPSVIAFVEEGREKAITESLRASFAERGIKTRLYLLNSIPQGASVILS